MAYGSFSTIGRIEQPYHRYWQPPFEDGYARSTYYDPHAASHWASRAPTPIAAYQPVIETPPASPPLLQGPPRPTVLTPADEYARLARSQRRIADEKKRIQKAARAARDELYEARKVVKDAQQAARAARERAARYTYIPASRTNRASSPSSRTAKGKEKEG